MKKKIQLLSVCLLVVALSWALTSVAGGSGVITLVSERDIGSVAETSGAFSNARGVVWDNGMAPYDGIAASQYDPLSGPLDPIVADDFIFDADQLVSDVHWIGGYWNGPPDDGDFDWEIKFYSDNAAGTAPDVEIASYTFANASVNETFLEGVPGGSNYYSYSVDLPSTELFLAGNKYWISIQGLGNYPPQSGIAFHQVPITMNEAVFKSDYFGFPNWVNGYDVFGYSMDLCFQLTDDGAIDCDWSDGDPYKMHYPQFPDEAGWDVNATFPAVMADDFECIETGYIKDIHFWGSWKDGATGIIDSFGLSLHTNITEQENPDGYSKPGELLWYYVASDWTEESIMGAYMEGWIDPVTGEVLTDNHQEYFQYNICLDEPDWFFQDAGTIYWLDITAYLANGSTETWGWKTSIENFMDDAVYMGPPTCTAPDNGTGTVDLPADCPYFDDDDPLMIIDGLAPGTEIVCDPTLDEYYNQIEYPGGSLGGNIHEFDAMLTLDMNGTGDLAGFQRTVAFEVHVEVHTGPRNPGDPVQTMDAVLWSMTGYMVGDPDFDFLGITAGEAYGLPSPGQFEITDIGGGLYHIDSFFDVTYQIEFEGAPGSILDGMYGITEATSRWVQGGTGGGWQELREPVLEQDWIVNAFWAEIGPGGEFLGGGGENAFGDGWYYYPWYDWWNVWFYDHPYDPTRYKEVHFDVEFMETMPGAYVEFALNWSTDLWSIDQPPGDSSPPLPGVDEDLYIGREILYAGPVPPGMMPFDFVLPDYNPEWVSVDIRGMGFAIPQGIIAHSCTGYSLTGQSLDLAFVITGEPEEPVPYDTVVCEPQDQNPLHPPTYWYDVTPTIYGRCDFHVMVFDSVASHYSNFVEPAGWTHELHKVGNDWWISYYEPTCTAAIFTTFRFAFDNPYMSTWGDWRTTIDGSNDPYAQVVDSAENHTAEPDGYGYRVHVPYFEAPDVDTCTYYKEPFEDYAPFGMPDFDQKQAGWISPFTGNWSYCGPAAVANCFWWFDSKFETVPMVPPAISDNYPLVQAYGPWDDHDPSNVIPFISALGVSLNTDMIPLGGTNIHMMHSGVVDWLTAMGLIAEYSVTLMPGDNPMMFEYIMEQVLISQDVILLLGFWEELPTGECYRMGGHYVTVAGVCPYDFGLCISDPYFDMHEGEPPAGAAHPAGVHNDAQFISGPHGTIYHDKYLVGPIAHQCQPPFTTEVYGYPNNPIDLINFEFLNDGDIPSEGYHGGEIFTVIEYALVICPVDCDALIGEANNSGAIDIDDVVYLISYIFSGGPAPVPYGVASGDANCSCAVDIDDVVYLIAYIFSGGPAPCSCEEWVAACGTLH